MSLYALHSAEGALRWANPRVFASDNRAAGRVFDSKTVLYLRPHGRQKNRRFGGSAQWGPDALLTFRIGLEKLRSSLLRLRSAGTAGSRRKGGYCGGESGDFSYRARIYSTTIGITEMMTMATMTN